MPRERSPSPSPDPTPVGRWRITAMPGYDRDYVDAEGKAYIHLEQNGGGEFHFGYVHGSLHFERKRSSKGNQAVAFTWEGNDECDRAFGRGSAVLKSPDRLVGRIVFHGGDDMKFRARRKRDVKGNAK